MDKMLCFVVAVLVFLPGCGNDSAKESRGQKQGSQQEVTNNDLTKIGVAYHNYHDKTGKGPAKADDLAPLLDDKKLLDHLKQNRIVFLYGVGIRDMRAGASNTVLAYEATAPVKGGLVLMGDGSVGKMTAAEFKKTTLAKKK